MKPIIAVPATLLLVYRAYSKKSLTPGGLFAATLTAIAHAVHPWNLPFVLLVVFFLAGTRATHVSPTCPPPSSAASLSQMHNLTHTTLQVKEDVKARLTLKSKGTSGGEGPRNHVQVFANSLTASIFSLLHAYQLRSRQQSLLASPEGDGAGAGSLCYAWGGDILVIGIIANYACVAADTLSSELGILATGEPRLITSLTLRKVPRGTNGGVTLTGLAAGLLGSVIIVTASMLFLPFCTEQTAGRLGGGAPWSVEQRRTLILGLTLWGLLGSIVDSILGGLFQSSVKDIRSGKIIEGDGGVRVLVSADQASMKRRLSAGDGGPSRVVENGWDLLDNNDVNFLMAFGMSVGAMAVASWYWQIPLTSVFPGASAV